MLIGARYRWILKVVLLISLSALYACDKKNINIHSENQKLMKTDKMSEASLCDFHQGPCLIQNQHVTISVNLNKPHAPSEALIHLDMMFSKPVTKVKAELKGRDMFMGIIPIQFYKQTLQQYSSELIYGRCSSGYMVWNLQIHYQLNNEIITSSLSFLADND